MQRNRFFKSTVGVGAEYVIANTIDTSQAPVDGLAPTGATVTVTVAGTPTLGDRINFVVGGAPYSYLVKSTDTTAATLVASIVTYLNAVNTQSFVASVTGTTSAVFTLTAPLGIAFNGTVVTATLGTPNAGPTYSALSFTNFGTNGVDPIEPGMQSTFQNFVANAASGALGIYWVDNQLAVLPGATKTFANLNRDFFYAFKTQDGNTIVTGGLACNRKSTFSSAYNAGQADIKTITFGGTYTVGQMIRVRIIDKTSVQVPYPQYIYELVATGTINTDVASLAALINAEQSDPIVTASAGTNVLTITGVYNSRQIDVGTNIDTFGTSGNGSIDQTAPVIATTQTSVAEVGTVADLLEFEKYFKVQNGIMIYTPEGTIPAEFGTFTELIPAGAQYGFLVVTGYRSHSPQSAAVPGAITGAKVYIMIAVPNTLLAQLASY